MDTVNCIFCDAENTMDLIATSYGFTGGDKWQCVACKGYVVTRPGQVPVKEGIVLTKEVMKYDLNKMELPDSLPVKEGFIPITIKAGDRFRMTLQGVGKKEIVLLEIIRG